MQAGIDAGLIPMHAATANLDEWDEYEWKYCRSIERYAREQPEDPDVPAMLERIRKWRDAYLRWGRDTLGLRRLSLLSAGPAHRVMAQPSGYSGKPLWQKLGLKAGIGLMLSSPPANIDDVARRRAGRSTRSPASREFDVALAFVDSRTALEAALARLRRSWRQPA